MHAKSAEVPASVCTGESAVSARTAEVPAPVSTGGDAVGARSAEVPASVSTGGDAIGARSVEAVISTNYSTMLQRSVVFLHTIVEPMAMTMLPPNYNGDHIGIMSGF